MKLSLKWVQEFVQVEDYLSKPQELSDLLTKAGFEVEATHDARSLYHQVVVGHILEKEKHPNADKLSVCRVATGQNQVHQIVCGAQNHKVGDRVVLALPGAVLPGGLAIKKSALRGVESSGMLCSFKELQLEGPSEGIAILDSSAPVGKSFSEFWGLDDVIFELKVTPNRADALSHLGLAREIAALLQRPMKMILKPLTGEKKNKSGEVQVTVKDSVLCPRYMGRTIHNVRVQPSPAWLQKRLESVGLKSINNVVDVTNLILMELGQPLHAFDADQIHAQHIIIDRAVAGEEFTTLDQKKLKLTVDSLTIRDSERPLCLAGVMGGLNSGTTVDTKTVFLEAAYFVSESVRKTSRQHGLDSDSAYRFSRGIDSEMTALALQKATQLIEELTGGKAAEDYVDLDSRVLKQNKIEVSVGLITQRLGYLASFQTMKSFAERLHFKIESESADKLVLVAPSFRHDMAHPMDFVEEYARLDGYEKIPESLPALKVSPTPHDPQFLATRSLAHLAVASGFSQSLNFAFCSKAQESEFLGAKENLKKLNFKISDESIPLVNPLNEELNVMRSSLSLSLWNNVLNNYRYGNQQGKLFETGQCFYQEAGVMKETLRLSMAAWGESDNLWEAKNPVHPVYQLKAFLENLNLKWNLLSLSLKSATDTNPVPSFLHQGQWAVVEFRNQAIGWMGTLHPQILSDKKVRAQVAMLEIELPLLIQALGGTKKITTPSKYPAVTRDIALVLPKDFAAGEVLKVIKQKAGPKLSEYKILDVFEGAPLEAGKKSLSVRLTWQDPTQTLLEEAVSQLQAQLVEELTKSLPVALR